MPAKPERTKQDPLTAVWNGMSSLAKRLIALEQRPLPRDDAGIVGAHFDDEDRLVFDLSDGRRVTAGRIPERRS